MNKFFYIDTESKDIQGKKYLCIYTLELTKKIIFKSYKLYTDELANKLKNLKIFQDITNNVYFVIKRDGKISIDINF